MKNFILAITAVSSIVLFGACTSDDDIAKLDQSLPANTRAEGAGTIYEIHQPTTLDLLETYINKVKFASSNTNGGRKKAKGIVPSYTLTPYVYEGDTVMYVAQYTDGWELLSTDERTPIVLASSETGTFNQEELPEVLKDYIESIADEVATIKSEKNTDLVQHNDWAAINVKSNMVNPQKIHMANGTNSGTGPGSIGYWYLLGSDNTGIIEYDSIDHLINTHWHQESPFNNYVPYSNGIHSPVGCMPVAAGQLIRYYFDKDLIQTSIPATATYNSSTNTYTYSNFQYGINALETTSNYSTCPRASVFLGYLGQQMSTKYSFSSSSTKTINLMVTINQYLYPNVFSEALLDENYVLSSLQSGYPILATATKKSNGNGGHAFIIDKYKTKITLYKQSYGWVGEDNEGNPTNEFDELGHPLDFTYFMEEDYYHNQTTFSMNWGNKGSGTNYWEEYDNIEFPKFQTDWIMSTGNNYKYNKRMIHP